MLNNREAENERRRERMLTPLTFRVQKLSTARPPFPKDQKHDMTQYRKEQPCEGAVWKRKAQWWQLPLDSLLDLADLQKKVGSSISLDHGVLTINDAPGNGEGVC